MSGELGVVAAGHPVTAEAGARVLREGGNAVDAAVCAVLASFVAESPLTGFGAGGFMLVHEPGGETVTIDFFVAAGGGEGPGSAKLVPAVVYFDATPQTFNIGPASCGIPGNPGGLERAAERFGSMPLSELARPAIALAREGVRVNREQAYVLNLLTPILTSTPEALALYAPEGHVLAEGELFRDLEIGDALERLGAEGATPFYRGEVAEALGDWVRERGGTLGRGDLASYEPIEREPIGVAFRGAEILTNPPPSSGGILIAYALGLLQRLGPVAGVERTVAAIEAANASRAGDFHERLHHPGFAAEALDPSGLDAVAGRIQSGGWAGGGGGRAPRDLLGSTTHVSVLDGEGRCASVTCSNGSCSGVVVPGTGVHLNNMLGEQDLNPGGFGAIPPGRRVSSMMAPTVALRGGEIGVGLGSAGSNRIRSAILQTILRALEDGLDAQAAVEAARLHFEDGVVQAEPGVDAEALDELERRGVEVRRWERRNLYFGGCQAVARDPASGAPRGGADPRRGGAVAYA